MNFFCVKQALQKRLSLVNSDFSMESCSFVNTATHRSVKISLSNHNTGSIDSSTQYSAPAKRANYVGPSFRNASCKRGGGRDKNMHITKMLIMISASFVLLNLPYFVAWCRYALFRIHNAKPFTREQATVLLHLYNIVKLAEILNLFNYAITGILYFATGKIYRDNLYSFMHFGASRRRRSKSESVLYS